MKLKDIWDLKPDFGTLVYKQIEENPFYAEFFGVETIDILSYPDRISLNFTPTHFVISSFKNHKTPINLIQSSVTLVIFGEDLIESPETRYFMENILQQGQKICLRVKKSLEYRTEDTNNVILPLVLDDESLNYFKNPITKLDREQVEKATLNHQRRRKDEKQNLD